MKQSLLLLLMVVVTLSAKAQTGAQTIMINNSSTCAFSFVALALDPSGPTGYATATLGLPTGTTTLTAASLTSTPPAGTPWEFYGIQMATTPTLGSPDGGAWDDANSPFARNGNSGSFYVSGCGTVNVMITPSSGGTPWNPSGTPPFSAATSPATVTIW